MNTEQINTTVLPPLGDIPSHLVLQESETIVRHKADDLPRAVFFAGDTLPGALKRIPTYRLGGRLVEQQTVPGGILTRCAITRLEKTYLAVHKNLVEAKERKNYIQSYTKTNVWNPATRAFETVEIGGDGASADLIFKELFPSQQIGQLTGKQNGVVEIPIVRNLDDIKTAQMFYFPDWFEYLTGQLKMPATLPALTDHLRKRIQATTGTDMRQIGEAMLESCRQYREWAIQYTAFQSKQIKDAEKTPGVYQGYSEVAERLFAEVGIARADNMTENFSANMAQNASTQDKMADILANMNKQSEQTNQINALLLNHLTGGTEAAQSVQNASTIQLPDDVLARIARQVSEALNQPESKTEMVEMAKDETPFEAAGQTLEQIALEGEKSESEMLQEDSTEESESIEPKTAPVPVGISCTGKTSKNLPCKMPPLPNGKCKAHQD